MFIIDTSNKVPNRKVPIKEAYPDAAASLPDICLINTANTSGILLNSKMLREALLNSKDFLNANLGIIIQDKNDIIEEAKPKQIKRRPTQAKVINEGEVLYE